jgi:hypothetical protein
MSGWQRGYATVNDGLMVIRNVIAIISKPQSRQLAHQSP